MFSKFPIAFTILNKIALKSKPRLPVKCATTAWTCRGVPDGGGAKTVNTLVTRCHRECRKWSRLQLEPRKWGRLLRTTSATDNVHGIWYKRYSRLFASGGRRILAGGQFSTEEMGEAHPKKLRLTQLLNCNN